MFAFCAKISEKLPDPRNPCPYCGSNLKTQKEGEKPSVSLTFRPLQVPSSSTNVFQVPFIEKNLKTI
jgi:hypothetical protein